MQLFVGIDVSKDKLDVAIRPTGQFWSVPNSLEGWTELAERLSGLPVARIVMEHSGGYQKGAFLFLAAQGFPVSVVNAKVVREFAKATGKLAKTDKVDAFVLAHYGEAIKPAVSVPLDEARQRLKGLVERRAQLVKMKVAEENRLQQAEGEVAESIRRVLGVLEKEIKAIEAQIRQVLREDGGLREKVALLKSMPGVGEVTAVSLLVWMPELGQVSRRKVASLAGLAPISQESGRRVGKRAIGGGRKEVRQVLYPAVLAAIRVGGEMREYYEGLIRRGKSRKAAIVACMRKMLVILNAMLRDGVPYREGKGGDEVGGKVA